MPDPIYIAWAANGHIRKWDFKPFEIDGVAAVEYAPATTISLVRPDGRPGTELTGREADLWLAGWRAGMERAAGVVEREIAEHPGTDYAAHIALNLAAIAAARREGRDG